MKPMPRRAAISLSADAISNACARLSSTHGPAIKASGSALPKRTLPTATAGLGFAVIGSLRRTMIAAPHRVNRRRLLQRREGCRPQEGAFDVGDDRPVLFAVVADFEPGRIGGKRVPLLLALGERFPDEQIMQVVVAVTDQHGPEADLLDAVLFPDLQGMVFEPLEQRRQPVGYAGVDAQLVNHQCPPVLSFRCRAQSEEPGIHNRNWCEF